MKRGSIENAEPAPGINSLQSPETPTDFPGQLCSGNEVVRSGVMMTLPCLEAGGVGRALSDANLDMPV